MKNRQRFIETSPYDLLLKMNDNITKYFKDNGQPCQSPCIMDALNYGDYECGETCEQCIQDWLNKEE